jgi:glycosyltransferase involved in cell wall biosynthesis
LFYTILRSQRVRALRVLVVTPLGEGGRGGIDRIIDEIRRCVASGQSQDIFVTFCATRGKHHILFSIPRVLMVLLRLSGATLGLGPDVVHINLSQNSSTWRKMIIARVARLLGIPYVIHLHGSGFQQFWERAPPFAASRISDMFFHSVRTLVLGNIWRSFVLSKVPEIEDRIEILPNATPAVDIAIEKPNRDWISIVFLGLVSERKGVPKLVEALSALPSELKWRATIAGNGDVEVTRQSISRLGLSRRVDLPGWVGPEEARRLLLEGDILVLPSFEENLPMSVVEGMAYGLSVVTTPVGAIEDIIEHGKTGLLVPPGDSAALAAALERLLAEPALRAQLGQAAQAFQREHLEIGKYYARLLDIWRSGAKAAHLRPPCQAETVE